MSTVLIAPRAVWQAVADALAWTHPDLAIIVRAGLAFAPGTTDPSPEASVVLTLGREQAAAAYLAAGGLGLPLREAVPPQPDGAPGPVRDLAAEQSAAVAAADAIVRAHQHRLRSRPVGPEEIR